MSRPLRVGLNLVYWERNSGGSGRYARELMRAMLAVEPGTEITAFVSTSLPADVLTEAWAPRVTWVRYPMPATGNPAHLIPELGGIAVAAARRRLDVVHGLAYLVPLLSPGVATVVSVLDTIWMQHPETVDFRFQLVMRPLVPLCARRADRVVAISHAARQDLVGMLGVPSDKVDVTQLGIRLDSHADALPPAALHERFRLDPDRPVVLCVAQKRPHKNLGALIRAVAALGEAGPQLALPGAPTEHERELRALAEELGIGDRVVFPAWVEEDELEGLYALARCVALPSFSEGFGLPVLEAMARGVPVVCADATSFPEVAGDAALLFDPHRPDELAAALRRVLDEPDLAADLAARGRERCREFTWERTARATLASYRRALA